jgi:hypothetical protein
MNISELKKKLNSGQNKFSEEESIMIIKFLKRLAEIEHTSYLKKKKDI